MSAPTIHITDVMAYKACRRAWYWGSRYQSALEPIRPHSPFFIGRAVHYVVEQLRSAGTEPIDALAAFLRTELKRYAFVDVPAEPMRRSASGHLRNPDWEVTSIHIRKDIALIRSLIECYMVYSRKAKGPFADIHLDSLAHEMKFGEGGDFPSVRLSVGGIPLEPAVYLAGTLDGLSRLRRDGTIWIEEYKTCRDIDERAALLQHDEQATAYCFAAGQLMGQPVKGVIYTLMRKKIPTQPKVLANGKLSVAKAIDTTPEVFRKAIYNHHGDVSEDFIERNYGRILQEIRDFNEPFVSRVAIERSPEQIDAYIRELHQTAVEMYSPTTPLYANRTFSCPGCPFRQPCLALDRGESNRLDVLLKSAYRLREL